jgi:hypothetical protein
MAHNLPENFATHKVMTHWFIEEEGMKPPGLLPSCVITKLKAEEDYSILIAISSSYTPKSQFWFTHC